MDALLGQVSPNTKDLGGLQERMDANLSKHMDVREEIIKQREQTIKGRIVQVKGN